MKKILILGTSSFAGSSFLNYILNKNYIVFGTYFSKKYLFIDEIKNKKNIKFIKLDLSKNFNKLYKLVERIKPNIIIDFASICLVNESWKSPQYYFNVNFNSRIKLFNNSDKFSFLDKYIYISTPEIFGSSSKKISELNSCYNPSTPYAASKLGAELLINLCNKNFKKKFIIARFSNFYGRGQPLHRLIPKTIKCIIKKKKFPLHGKGMSKRDYIFDEDFNLALFKLIKLGKVGNKYHFSTNKFYSVYEVVEKICGLMNYSSRKLIKFSQDRIGKDKNYFLSNFATTKSLGWKPKITLLQGLKKTIKYYEQIIN